MKIEFIGPERDGRGIPATGQWAKPGEVIEVPDNIGAGLIEQEDVWKRHGTSGDDTVDGVLKSVGDDRDLAAAALEAEIAGKNRKALVKALTKIAEGE